jgi:hypothetical protein
MHRHAPSSRLVFACVAALALLTHPVAAQTPETPFLTRNAYYVEAGGNALLYSVNYERMVAAGLSARVGLSLVPAWIPFAGDDGGDGGALLVMVPVQAGYVFGTGNHHLEIGAGATFGNASMDIGSLEGKENWVFGTGTIGYRFQRPEGGSLFRLTVTPLFIEVLDVGMIPMIGLSYGRSF